MDITVEPPIKKEDSFFRKDSLSTVYEMADSNVSFIPRFHYIHIDYMYVS